jgi:hypothetical protein
VPTTVAIRYIVHQFLLKQEQRQHRAHSGKREQKTKQTKRRGK